MSILGRKRCRHNLPNRKNGNGERQHLFNSFAKKLKDTWPKEKLTTCTLNTKTTWKGDCNLGGTSITLKGRLSSSVIIKGQDNLGLGRWTFTTLLGRNNNKTTIFNLYRPGNTEVTLVGNSTVTKQQWIILKQLNRKGHPHDVIINDLILAIKEKQKNNDEIMLTIDGNKTLSSSSGGIAKVCKACKRFDPLYQQHGESIEGPSHINGSDKMYFIFVTTKLLPFIKSCGSTAFNELTTSDHKGFYIDILREGIMKRIEKSNITIYKECTIQ